MFLQKIEIDCPTVLPDWDFTLYENRLVTFALCEWDLSRFGPEILAEIGFYYVVQKNILKCVFCFMEIKYQWSDKEDPVKKHKREHPLCSIFRSHRCMFERIKNYYNFSFSIVMNVNI